MPNIDAEPKSARAHAPRLWKAEPEPTEEESPPAKKSSKDGDDRTVQEIERFQGVGRERKDEISQGEGTGRRRMKRGKKVLIEETPTLDTYETRRAPG